MHWIDWLIMIMPLAIVTAISLWTRRYVKGVSDFLTAGRVAGRYVVCVANGEAALGLITVVAMFQMYYKCGFAVGFWGGLGTPIALVILLTGFAVYRFRETRAMTMGQFLEIRYSRKFRMLAGVLQSISGIVNYGLFPAVGARFIMCFCGLPSSVQVLGMNWPVYGILLAMVLGIAVLMVTIGGQITVMVTDCVQGILSYPMYLIVVVAILWTFSWWGQMGPTLLSRPQGESMLNPFDTYRLEDFNLFFVVVAVIAANYNMMSWSGNQGFSAAAASAHEQKMGKILGVWRGGFSTMMLVLVAISVYSYMNNPDFAARSQQTNQKLSWRALSDVAPDARYDSRSPAGDDVIKARQESLPADKAQVYGALRDQMRLPMALRDILPVGVIGVFGALMIFLMVSTDTSYLHSWGSIIIQDIVLPLRKKPFTPHQQLLLLRLAIAAVAIYAFFFSLLFGQVTYILMFFALTGAVWLGGAGAVILGGLYWRRATAAGAWAGLLTGSIFGVLGFIGVNYWVGWIYPALKASPTALAWTTSIIEGIANPFRPIINWRVTPDKFALNGQEIYFLTMVFSVAAYVVVSLATCREPFNMDRMLHRGKYRRQEEAPAGAPIRTSSRLKGLLHTLLGMDDQFTRGDKILSWSVFLWSMGWGFGSWLVVLAWNVVQEGGWPGHWWSTWFFINYFVIGFAVGLVSTVWFSIGGTWDLWRMFKRLAVHKSSVLDDGRVIGHVNADDVSIVEKVEHTRVREAHEAEKVLAQAGLEQEDDEPEKTDSSVRK